jgi:uncharacterized membrane protein YkvA (DUF1232 family)
MSGRQRLEQLTDGEANIMLTRLKQAAGRIRQEVMTVYFAARDPRTPLVVRLLALGVAAYALSPIDLIPDFIPVLGMLDEILLLPLAIMLILWLAPAAVVVASRARALEVAQRPSSKLAAFVIIALWCVGIIGGLYWLSGGQGD